MQLIKVLLAIFPEEEGKAGEPNLASEEHDK